MEVYDWCSNTFSNEVDYMLKHVFCIHGGILRHRVLSFVKIMIIYYWDVRKAILSSNQTDVE